MDKNLVCMFAALAVMGGAAWYQHRPAPVPPPPAAPAAKGKPGSGAALPGPPAAAADAARKLAAEQAVHAEIDAALHAMKVTSILLGEPAIVIINKEEYSVGSPLKLPGGKILQVKGIDEGGVAFAYQTQSFHLDAPGAPDLAATRKGR